MLRNRLTTPLAAPTNCLQYFYQLVGQVKSFNYDYFSQGFTYFNNMDYTICFKKEVSDETVFPVELPSTSQSGFCTATFSVPRDEDSAFSNEVFFDGNIYADNSAVKPARPLIQDLREYFDIVGASDVAQGTAGAGPFKCPTDYLIINYVRLCGYRLNADLYSNNAHTNHAPVAGEKELCKCTANCITFAANSTGPLHLRFVSDHQNVGKGFLLNYQMNPCLING